MKRLNLLRAIGMVSAVLLFFLTIATLLLVRQQRDTLHAVTRYEAGHYLELMADASLEPLAASNHAAVRSLVERWGKDHDEIRELRVVAPNGFVLAEFRSAAQPRGEVYESSEEIRAGAKKLATLRLIGDYRDAEVIVAGFARRMALWTILITLLLCGALWFVFRRLALTPMERTVDKAAHALTITNADLEKEICDRIKAEKTALDREEHITLLLDSIAEGIYGVDAGGRCTFINQAALRLLGYEHSEELLGTDIDRLVRPALPGGAALSDGEGKSFHGDDEVFRRSDGTCFDVEYWRQPIMRSGALAGAVVAFFDITGRRRMENALRSGENLLKAIIDAVPDCIKMIDAQGNLLMMNRAGLDMVELDSFDQAKGKNICPLVAPDSRQAMMDLTARVFQGEPGVLNFELVGLKGRRRWLEMRAAPFRNEKKEIVSLLGITRDISERMRSEVLLRESEEKFRTLFEESRDAFYISTPAGKFLEINPAGVELFGYNSREELLAIDIGQKLYVSQKDRERFVEFVDRAGYAKDYPVRMRRKDGAVLNVAITSTAVRNSEGAVVAFRGVISDETERKKLEEQLRQSQKMESIGTLAGGVAHDFNNILTVILGYGNVVRKKMSVDDPQLLNVQHILDAADRAARLTKDLLMFSRKQPIDRRPVDLNESIQKLAKFLTRVIGEDIAFKTTLSGGAISVLADSYQLDQVLMNLATNARDAMLRGGAFTIATELVWLNESFTSAHGLGRPGNYAVISASDTGRGMDEETRQRIFEPFFTTKEVGKGTGLGLSVVYGIVQQHDGQVTVYSEPGHGTTFRIYLPVNETNASAETAAIVEEIPVGGTETILLAEDEKNVREMTQLLLEDFGYTVITAIDGEDAVKKFSEHQDRIQLLLFDLIMPVMSGKDAYDEIRKLRPDIKVIFASGYDPDQVRQKALLAQNVPVVYKPVPMAVLLKKMREVLDGNEGDRLKAEVRR